MLALAMTKAASVVSPDPDIHLHQCTVFKTQRHKALGVEELAVWHHGNSTCSEEKCLLKVEADFVWKL